MLRDTDDFDDDGYPDEAARADSGFLRLDQIDGEQTSWLWTDRIPRGHVTIVAGASGSGKSVLAAEIAARTSSGAAWPGELGQRPNGGVLIAQSKRHENSVLKRRLLAAGADAERVAVVNRDAEACAGLTPAEYLLCILEGTLVQLRGVSLVVIDDLLGWLFPARLGPDELAALLEKLADLAARRRIALETARAARGIGAMALGRYRLARPAQPRRMAVLPILSWRAVRRRAWQPWQPCQQMAALPIPLWYA